MLRSNLTGLIVAAGKETHTAAYEPFRRHSSRAVPADPAEAAEGGAAFRAPMPSDDVGEPWTIQQ